MPKDTRAKSDQLKKIEELRNQGIEPYKDKFKKTHQALEIKGLAEGEKVKTAGRIMLFRTMGRLTFLHIQDFSGRVQLVLKADELGQKEYDNFLNLINIGDFVGVDGEVFVTKKGEVSVLVKSYQLLSKSLRNLPDKWHGLKDRELCYRQRYLDLLMNEETRERFKFKSQFIWELRKFYIEHGFYEVDTPVLGISASGALAKPFITHHNAFDMDVYLRIAPEIHLKEAIIGGWEKIFEVARVFRNEGIDPSHLQEFNMVEHYCAYWDYKQNMKFTEEMFAVLIKKLKGTLEIEIMDREGKKKMVNFTPPWPVVTFRKLLLKDCGIDINEFPTVDELRTEIKKKKIPIDDIEKLGRGNLIDALYKEVSRPKLVGPVFLTEHPIDLSPLARRNDKDSRVVDRFQLVVNGWEIVNAYSELIDPQDQKQRFAEQAKAREQGDEEAMLKDDEYVNAMEYGLPPVSGWGMGVERVVALLTGQLNLKDVVMFPLMKPSDK